MSDLIKYPCDDEICQVAQDESQQDWNDYRYASVYEEAFSDGAKWMRTEVSNVNSNKLYTQSDMDKLLACKEKYYELLYQVSMKHPNESRHETALRYLKNAEISSVENCSENIPTNRSE